MKQIAALLLFSATALSAGTKWHDDVRAFGRELPKRHAAAFHRVSREDFQRAVAALEARDANDSVMFVELSRIAAMIGDGHTYVLSPPTARRFPIGFQPFDTDWRVTHTIDAHKSALGAKLVRINDTPVAEAVKLVEPLIAQGETDAYIRASVTQWLNLGDALHGLGITPARDRVTYTLQRDDGTAFTLEPASLPFSEAPKWVFASKETPLARQRPAERFWYSWLEPQKTVYVAFRGYDDLRAKSKELWQFVDSHPVEKLVLDLRANGGGDYTKGKEYIVDQVKRRPKLRTFALVGARTFSAAMNNAAQLRDAGATLVGTTVGERPNSYQENDQFTLPSSKLVVSYSTRFYKFVPEGTPNVIEPDQRIEPTWDDYLAGHDPALAWVLGGE